MSDDLIKEKINKYFQLKAKYNEQKDKLIKNKYEKLKNKGLSKNEIKEQIKNIQVRCINCNKVGGTIFMIKDGNFIAKCNCATPCKLNIEISKGFYYPSNKVLSESIKQMNIIKENIVKTKMKHILEYIDNNSASIFFKNHKKELNSESEYYLYSKLSLEDIIEENRDDTNFENEIIEFKKMISDYNETLDKVKLKEAILYQIENIEENRKEKSKLEYSDTEQIDIESKIIQYKVNI